MNKIHLFLLAAAAALLASCASPRQVQYLRDVEYGEVYPASHAPELRLQPEDRLAIQVFSSEPKLAAPFNTVTGLDEGGNSVYTAAHYLVDKHGDIDFPVLGKLHVEGRTTIEVNNEITRQIIELGHIKEPVVKVELENFHITYLGEHNNGIITVKGESLNVLEAVAQIGSLSRQTRINDIMVIRTENGQRQAYRVNLQTKDVFDSPVYYLQQNDLIYIKPRGLRTSQNLQTINSTISPIIYIANVISNILIWRKL